jgi:hypothetical protein
MKDPEGNEFDINRVSGASAHVSAYAWPAVRMESAPPSVSAISTAAALRVLSSAVGHKWL